MLVPQQSQRLHQIGMVLAVLAGFLVAWHVAVLVFKFHPIVLPSPYPVALVAWKERVVLCKALVATGGAALLGLGLSIVIGSIIAMLFSQSSRIRAAFYPYVVFLQTVPIVAIAPLLITWFGYGFRTVVLVAMIISLFPIVSNVTAGLISVDQNLTDLFRLSRATRWQLLVKLRIPSAISHLVLGTRISAGLAVIGAIVGELFVGYSSSGYDGLGAVMTHWQNLARTDAIMAAVAGSTLLGVLTLGFVNFAAAVFLRRWTSGNGN